MPAANTPYNQIAGQSVECLAAIGDGIFAVAMTLLVLDLHDPDSLAVPHLMRVPAENSNKSKS